MKHRTYTMIAALALSLSLLAGCGSQSGSSQSGSENTGSQSSSSEDISTPDGSSSTPDGSVSTPDGSSSTPDGSSSSSQDNGDQEETDGQKPEAKPALSLSSTDFTLFQASASYTLKATVTGLPQGTKVTYQSGNEKVATVDDSGKITAVAPGTAKVTVTAGDLTATCVVRCKFETEKPDSGSGSSSSGSGSSSSGSGAESGSTTVDLAAFYETVQSSYQMPSLTLADQVLMDQFYAGLSAISLNQNGVYVNAMTMNNGELALVEVKNSSDVDKVKAIFQARIDYMVGDGNGPGGAWYPEPTRIWDECSRIVSNGNYVMMVVGEDCDSIVSDFNALF